MAIIATKLNARYFDFNPNTFTFVAEASDFGRGTSAFFSQVYDDACDAGFTLIGKTGAEVTFIHSSTDMSGGDIAGWRFTPTSDSIRRVPACAKVSALIIND